MSSIFTSGDFKRYKIGTYTANGATTVDVAAPGLTASSVVLFVLNTVGGTPAAHPYIFTKGAGTMGVRAAAGDTSVYDVYVLN